MVMMLETLNDYISLVVMIFLVIFSIRLFIASIVFNDQETKKTDGILFGYNDNEDE